MTKRERNSKLNACNKALKSAIREATNNRLKKKKVKSLYNNKELAKLAEKNGLKDEAWKLSML